MPTIPADVSILWILAFVVVISQVANFWMTRQMIAELKARTSAEVELVKVIIGINNELRHTGQTLHRGHRAILDAVTELTKTTIETERQRRRDD